MDDKMNLKKSIKELVEYYIEKYNLLPKSNPDDSMDFKKHIGIMPQTLDFTAFFAKFL